MNKILDIIKNRKSKLSSLLENKNNAKVLENWLKCELAYTSNAIEGNTLTRKETARIIKDKITSSSKPFVHYQEALNHSAAFIYILHYVIEGDIEINEDVLLKIHKFILCGIDDDNAGLYRNCLVRISGSRVILPNYLKVPALMDNFFEQLKCADINNPLTAIEAHYKIVSIHPFVDGNGRCARLFMNLLLLKAGYAPIIIRPADRKRYLDCLEKGQLTQDTNSYTKFMLSRLNSSLQSVINVIDAREIDVPKSDLLKVSELANILNVRASAVRYWVKQDKIKPHTYTETGYMLFSKNQIPDIKKTLNL